MNIIQNITRYILVTILLQIVSASVYADYEIRLPMGEKAPKPGYGFAPLKNNGYYWRHFLVDNNQTSLPETSLDTDSFWVDGGISLSNKGIGNTYPLNEMYDKAGGLPNIAWPSSTVKKIVLSRNNLNYIDSFYGLKSTSYFDVSYNNLDSIKGLGCLGSKGDVSKPLCGGKAEGDGFSIGDLRVNNNNLSNLDGLEYLVIASRLQFSTNPITNIDGLKCLGARGDPSLPECGGDNPQRHKRGFNLVYASGGPGAHLDNMEAFKRILSANNFTFGNYGLRTIEGMRCFGGLGDSSQFDCGGSAPDNWGRMNNSIIELNNNNLTEVNALRHIIYRGRLNLSNNQLETLDGLICLGGASGADYREPDCGGPNSNRDYRRFLSLNVGYNNLTELEALRRIVKGESFYLAHNPYENITGLRCLGGQGDYSLPDCGGPSSIAEDRVFKVMYLNDTTLPNVDGLNNIAFFTLGIELSENPFLQNVNGLISLQGVGINTHKGFNNSQIVLNLRDNPSLQDISGLANLVTTNGFQVQIDDNNFAVKAPTDSPLCNAIDNGDVLIYIRGATTGRKATPTEAREYMCEA